MFISASVCSSPVTQQELARTVLLRRCKGTQEPRKCVGTPPGKAEEAMDASPTGSIGFNWHPGRMNHTGDLSPAQLAPPEPHQSLLCYEGD